MKQVDVVVMGQNYSTSLGLIQAAGEAGYNVGVVHCSSSIPKYPTPDVLSKYVVKSITISRNNPDFLSKLIDSFSYTSEKIVLLPADDYSVSFIDMHLSALEEFFYVPTIAHEEGRLRDYMDKSFQSSQSESVGILSARNWSIELDGTHGFFIPDGIIYPCLTKPQRSVGAPKTLIRICNNYDELSKVLSEVDSQTPCTILIEEFIQVDCEYTVPCLATKDFVLIPVFLRKEKIGVGAHKGVTISGVVIDSRRFEPITKKLQLFIKNTGVEGIVDVELLQSGNNFYFNELNLRYGAAGYALTRAGINMPQIWIRYCKGEKINLTDFIFRDGLSFVNDKAAIEDYGSGNTTWREYRKILSLADFRFIIDNPDISAAKAFRIIVVKTIIRRIVKKIKCSLKNIYTYISVYF